MPSRADLTNAASGLLFFTLFNILQQQDQSQPPHSSAAPIIHLKSQTKCFSTQNSSSYSQFLQLNYWKQSS